MRFVVFEAVLNADDELLRFVDRLVDRLADEIHQVDAPEADLLQDTAWYRTTRATLRKILTTAVAKPPRAPGARGPHLKAIELRDEESTRSAAKLAYAPFVLLVEDRESDGILVDILVEEVGWPELQALWKAGRAAIPPALEIVTAGGKGSIPARIDRAVLDAEEQGRPPRLFVLCDSDAKWPGDQAADSGPIQDTCADHNVPFHILKKRSAENYIPDGVLETVRDDPRNQGKRPGFEALLRRSTVQRDHFPLRDGLSAAEREKAILAGLYARSEEPDLELLEIPLFAKRPRPLKRLGEERRNLFTRAGLLTRDGQGEIEELLQAIAREL